MHFHMPKPIHGWRQFFGEVGIIVVGVLIALAAEELVQRRNWAEQVSEARGSMDAQLADAKFAALERVRMSECKARQLDQLDQLIEADRVPAVDVSKLAPIRLYGTSAWDAASASGAVAHMDAYVRARYSNLFSFTNVLGTMNRAEFETLSDLASIERHPSLSDVSRDRYAQEISRLRAYNQIMTLGSRQWLKSAEPLKLQLEPDDLKALKELKCDFTVRT